MNGTIQATLDWADEVFRGATARSSLSQRVGHHAAREVGKPPSGYTPIPGSKHNGYHAHIGGVWRTWYADVGNTLHPTERFTQDQHQKEHDAFRATPAGRRYTAREALDALGGRPSGELSPHAKKALAYLQEKVRVYEATKAPKVAKGEPKTPEAWQRALGGIELNAYPAPGSTEIQVHYDPKDPDRKVALTWRNKQGNKQGAYTTEHDRRSAAKKFARIVKLIPVMEAAKRKMRTAITRGATQRDRDTALVLSIIEHTGLRPGSRSAATRKGKNVKGVVSATYGVTTLLPEHVKENKKDGSFMLKFVGKSSKVNTRTITDRQLVNEIKKHMLIATSGNAEKSAGKREAKTPLFQTSEQDTRALARKVLGPGFKPKDLRTLWATNQSIDLLEQADPPRLPPDMAGRVKVIDKFVKDISNQVAEALGNTGTVARRSYIHPSVLATYINWLGAGDVIQHLFKTAGWLMDGASKMVDALGELGPCEEVEDEDGSDLEELESYPLSLVADYAQAGISGNVKENGGDARSQSREGQRPGVAGQQFGAAVWGTSQDG